jgi:hypothetical protein
MHIYTYIHIHIQTYINTYIHAYYIHIHTLKLTNIHRPTYARTYIHIHVCVCIYKIVGSHILTHAYALTNIRGISASDVKNQNEVCCLIFSSNF